MNNLEQRYFEWLYCQLKGLHPSYKKLCLELHKKPFRWNVPNDDNRCEDGLAFRHIYLEETRDLLGKQEVRRFMKGECTTFEVIVGLAVRMEFLLCDLTTGKNRVAKWFKELIRNLKLDRFTDSYVSDGGFDPLDEAAIDAILEDLLDRTYDYYGNGSLFPIKGKPPKDMAETEIWYQMMWYIDENHGQ